MTTKGYMNDFFRQYEELNTKFEKQEQLLKETNRTIKTLNNNHIFLENFTFS